MSLGRLITEYRIKKLMSKNALAHITGVSPTYIEKLETDAACPTVDVAARISKTLELPFDEMMAVISETARTRYEVLTEIDTLLGKLGSRILSSDICEKMSYHNCSMLLYALQQIRETQQE